ncbi:hypothetical protein PF005_g6922 [Phytophthora fragariae]|uniref:CCHC-type domain-containing protein n=1 Tax=Phytophthora fragariae TaxID=53985 RepID=A0A6A3YPN2_9STRA|nr:hypothetical protein PF005_g6922 [Phytophthora fragariae]
MEEMMRLLRDLSTKVNKLEKAVTPRGAPVSPEQPLRRNARCMGKGGYFPNPDLRQAVPQYQVHRPPPVDARPPQVPMDQPRVPPAKEAKLALRTFDGSEVYKGLGSGFEQWALLFIEQVEMAELTHGYRWAERAKMNAAFRVNISNRQAMKLLSSKKESTRTWNDHFLYLNAVMNASGASPTLVLENVVKYADPELKLAMMAKYDPARPDPLQQASELVNWAQSLADEEKPNKAMGRETAKETVSAMTDDRACFKCGKTGHIRRDCPLRQKKSGGDDANKVKWALAVSDRSLSKVLLAKGASRLTKGKPLQAWRR